MREKKAARPTDGPGSGSSRLGCGLLRRVLVEQGGPAELAQLQRSWRAPASGGAVARKRRPRCEGHLLLRSVHARTERGVVALCGRPSHKRYNHALFGVVLPEA